MVPTVGYVRRFFLRELDNVDVLLAASDVTESRRVLQLELCWICALMHTSLRVLRKRERWRVEGRVAGDSGQLPVIVVDKATRSQLVASGRR
jgi:hypothetical protein